MAATLSPGVRKLFEDKNFAHVATLMPDGSPQVTPVWVELQGDYIVWNSDESYQKMRNLRRDPRVAICIYDQESPERCVWIRGRVVEIRPDSDGSHVDHMSKKYKGTDVYEAHLPGEQRRIVFVMPERMGSEGVD